MKSYSFPIIISVIVTVFSATHVFAQETGSEADEGGALIVGIGFPESTQEFQGYIGGGVGLTPKYEGADDFDITALPLLEIGKPGAFFLRGASINPNDGIARAGLTLFHVSYTNNGHNTYFLLGPLLQINTGRDEDDSDVLNGLGDIDPSVGLGGFMEFKAGSWLSNITVSAQSAGDDNDGLLITFDTRYICNLNDNLTLTPILSASWADDEYMQGYFGVTPSQAARSGLSSYDSAAGIKDVGIQLHSSYVFSTHLSLEGQVGYWCLLNDAADSPIVTDKGSDGQLRGLIGLVYRF